MNLPTPARIYDAIDATWPPAEAQSIGDWTVRRGAGGGSRVSAATTTNEAADIAQMEQAQTALGQTPLVMVRQGQTTLDTALQGAGYTVKDPVRAYAIKAADLAQDPPKVTAFIVQGAPLTAQKEVWTLDGIGADRLAVMDRCAQPKCTVMGRYKDRPLGTAYLAADGDLAMLHALVVAPAARRQNLARHMMWAAASWAQDQGATWLSVVVTKANAPANGLYTSLGMSPVGDYHYRQHPSA
ncbi:GNAT family N-acetyltransferase [Alphaproteobacteria bacterium KMM 3653]|uniref:GNAT family N-acetyltransferase n=1 Tax=Harenicola maris TaxID=2841044 RepID=A0AAP2CQG2_9RHOB|nr:GNAT family N-acetyltransferase [Harenicola maris]